MGTLITRKLGYQLCWVLFLMFSIAHPVSGNETDRLALLEFKDKIIADPLRVMSLWNNSAHFCSWFGVTCGKRHPRVTELNLSSLQLGGSISPHIGKLTFLRIVDLNSNSLISHVPSEMGSLRRLQTLYLYNNSLNGEIPSNLSRCVQLVNLSLGRNKLVGEIPKELGFLSKLRLLSVDHNNLRGEIPHSLGNLSSLDTLSAAYNNLVESIPDALGQLKQLTFLGLAFNQLSGTVPPSIFNLSSLTLLDIGGNHLQGYLPADLFITLPYLNYLSVWGNQFKGSIPTSLSNASNLGFLDLWSNLFTGKVPSLQKLTMLNELAIWNNSLGTGEPDDLNFLCSLTNATGLQRLDIGVNKFGGKLRDCISNLSSKLTDFWLNGNQITGAIPPGIASLVSLNTLRLEDNHFSSIPETLGSLSNLSLLDVKYNNLQGNIPRSLGKCKSLHYLGLAVNNLSGPLPSEVFGLSLGILMIGYNNIYGRIPQSVCNATKLDVLDIRDNHLNGTIPDCLIAMTPSLGVLDLSGNNIGGTIPDVFGNGCRLETLKFNRNFLQGQIPRSLANCKKLKVLDVGNNQLHDTFPCELKTLSQLQVLILRSNKFRGHVACPEKNSIWPLLQILDLAANYFSGEIPAQFIPKWRMMMIGTKEQQSEPDHLQYNFSNGWYQYTATLTFKDNVLELEKVLKMFTIIDLSSNSFHGNIPRELGSLNALIVLNFSHNSLTGNIPSSFGNLSQLESLDLSCNALSGNIPRELANLNFLESLNVSFNKLVGPIPTGKQLQLFEASSYRGNTGLYGPPLTPRAPSTPTHPPGSVPPTHPPGSVPPTHRLSTKLKVTIATGSGIIAVALLLSLIFLLTFRKKKQATASSSSELSFPQVSYQDLHRATNGFSSNHLIGMGYFASVYKGILQQGEPQLAIKVFDLQRRGAAKSFLAECEALRNVKHRNIVKIITACSSIDYQGNEFKALVYEFMPHGSLEDWLHPVGEVSDTQEAPKNLTLLQRLNIVLDVASVLEYLHRECETPIVHCDLKPCNVLLDNELTGHVSDFGIAKLLGEEVEGNTSANPSSSIGVRGTIGYVAPEYGLGCTVSLQGDIYSYGILLLEMFTGKTPTADMFHEGWSLHQYARRAIFDGVEKIIDPTLVKVKRGTREEGKIMECFASILEIGVACSAECPGDRMNITDAAKRLHLMKKELLRLRRYYQLY